jgi:hypothetical protein
MSTNRYRDTVNNVRLYVLLSTLALFSAASRSEEVVLNPATITGTVQIGTAAETNITRADLYASTGGTNSWVYPTPSAASTSVPYSITVGVPASGTASATVQASSVYMDSYRDRISFPSVSVTLNGGSTTSGVDFRIQNPGFVQGTVTVSGGTLSSAEIQIQPTVAPYIYSYTSTTATLAGQYRVAVAPASGLRIAGTVTLGNGVQVSIPQQTFNVASGASVTVNVNVTAPTPGTVSGTISSPGSNAINQYYLFNLGAQQSLLSPFGANNSKVYTATVAPGTYYPSIYAYFNANDDFLYVPQSTFQTGNSPANRVDVAAGGAATVDINIPQAAITGTINVDGPVPAGSINQQLVYALGLPGAASGGQTQDRVNTTTGAMDLLVTPGSWYLYYAFTSVYRNSPDPTQFLNAYFYYYDYTGSSNPITVPSAGASVTRDWTIPVGKATLTLSVPSGTTLSNPGVQGYCYVRNSANTIIGQYNFGGSSSGQNNVSSGIVTFFAAGECYVTPQATIGGAQVSFAQTTLTIVPGSSQQVDVGGPTVTINYPEPGIAVDANQITVTGVVTDDVAVSSLTVNGQAATLTSTGNVSDPRERSFSVTAALSQKGPNTLTVVATDSSGKTATYERTVYNDSGAPQLAWAPADGATTQQAAATVAGTATDDAGIQSVTVNGVVASLSPSSGTSVSFSVPVTVVPGTNSITVVAKDVSQRTTTQTHVVTYVEADPPAVTPSITGTLGNGGWYVSDVTVSWSVDDVGGTITSSSGCGTTTIAADTAGTTLTCTANNLAGTDTDSVTVKRDATPPGVTLTPTNAPNMLGWYRFAAKFDVSGSDPSPGSGLASCDGPLTVNTQGESLTATGICSDVAGNQGTASETGLDIDWTPPSITSVAKSPPANAFGWNNTDVSMTVNATDALSGLAGCTPGTGFSVSTEGASQSSGIVCTDRAGNDSAADSVTVSIDKTPPSAQAAVSPAPNGAGWNNADATVSFSGMDALSGIDSCSPSAVVSGETTGMPYGGTCTDRAGNSSTVATATVRLDKTAPSVSGSVSPSPNAAGWNRTDVTVNFSGTDALSGVTSCTSPVTMTTEGADQAANGTCTDVAGNESAADEVTVSIDKTEPSATASAAPAANGDGWNNSDVTVSFAGTDTLSGIAACDPAEVLSAEGTNLGASGSCRDKADNVSTPVAVSGINLDKTAPAVLTTVSPAANANGWNNSAVTVMYTGTDALSGRKDCDPDDVLSVDGANQSATGACRDYAGNVGSETRSGIDIDQTPPVTQGSLSPLANAAGWNKTDVSVTFTATDALSGLDVCTGGATLTAEGAGQVVNGSCSDKAGNSDPGSTTVNIDKTAPSVTTARSPLANSYGWNNTNVTVSYSGTDALSTIASCSGDDVLSGEGAGQSATGSCTDKAGNAGSATASSINIDKTPPTVNVATPSDASSYIINASVLAAYTCIDPLAGIATCTAPVANGDAVDTSASASFTASGTDKAGNSASDSNSFTVRYGVMAFLQPIDNLPVLNSVNAGRTIPVKWQLLDGNGAYLTSLSTFRSLGSYAASCDAGAALDDIEEVAASGGTVLRYDSASNQFIYNWATASSWKGKCRKLVLELADGQRKEALFKFK